MKKLLLAIIMAYYNLSFAYAIDLEVGDVLLISLNCYECRVIESETDSEFSHSGVIINKSFDKIIVGQSLEHVGSFTLEQFLLNQTPGTRVDVYRPKEFQKLNKDKRKLLEDRMFSIFNSHFKGAPFDTKFLWNNFDSHGRELLYCSEFIAKYLDLFLADQTIPYLLSYKKNMDYWLKYFKGVVPEGEIGNSPSAFVKDNRFVFIGSF